MGNFKGYRDLTELEIDKINEIKELYQKLMFQIMAITEDQRIQPDMRAYALAKTKLEESAMWSVKAIARPTTIC